jgi:predicted transcriptional regulator
MEKVEYDMLKRANELLRTANSIAEREGKDTYWEGFQKQLKIALKEQHEYFYPTQKQIRLKKLNKLNEKTKNR